MKKIIIAFLCVFGLASCSLYHTTPVADSRFNGDFFYYNHWIASDGINETTTSILWYFDGSTKALQTFNHVSYNKLTGWHRSKDSLWYEIETKDDKYFRSRLWDNDFDSWSEWEEYEFLEDGTLRFYNKTGYNDFEKTM